MKRFAQAVHPAVAHRKVRDEFDRNYSLFLAV
jgi:hypothetical protein